VGFLIHLILLVYIRDKLVKMKDYFVERTTSPTDFSIVVKGLPQIDDIRNKLKLEIIFHLRVGKIADIVLIPDMTLYEQLEGQRRAALSQLRDKIRKGEFDQDSRDLERQVELKEIEIKKYIIEEKHNYVNNTLKAKKAIIILTTEQDKNTVLRRFKDKGFPNEEWQDVTMEEAPEPK
jgi:hypothetical protein